MIWFDIWVIGMIFWVTAALAMIKDLDDAAETAVGGLFWPLLAALAIVILPVVGPGVLIRKYRGWL